MDARIALRGAPENAAERDEESPNLHIRFVDEEAGNYRALVAMEEGQRVMKIMGRHPAIGATSAQRQSFRTRGDRSTRPSSPRSLLKQADSIMEEVRVGALG